MTDTPRFFEGSAVGDPVSLYPVSPYDRGNTGDPDRFPPTFENLPDGHTRIREERQRQRLIEGYDVTHDAQHGVQELVDAANCYLYEVRYGHTHDVTSVEHAARENKMGSHTPMPSTWPWEAESWKPSDNRLRNMEKAGALYLAASDLMKYAANNVGDMISHEIHKRLDKAGVL